MIEDFEHPSCGPLKLISSPVKYSRTQPSIRSPPPVLGQHTDEILSEVLDMDDLEIQRLKDDHVVIQSSH